MPNRSSSQQIQRPQWDNQRTIQLIRLVKAHYSVPHQEQPGLDKCQQPVDLHKTQDLVDSKVQDLVDSKVLPQQLVKVCTGSIGT